MRIVDLIEKKKNKEVLTKKEIDFIISGYVKKQVPDYQISALLMAIYFNGMTMEETINLTEAMMHSGQVIDLSSIKGIKADKHSTGGVGDKVTIALAPIMAALGVNVAKMSGRGLGFTGGTIDKLESIPGYKTGLTEKQFKAQVKKIGVAVIGQTGNLVPADKLLYALRDVTATVNSLPLISSSIMSKKLATGSDTILLDVKYGDGAFMKTPAAAKELANTMIKIGKGLKRDVRAEITSMNRPLGKAIGNKNEILEAVETLQGNGPKDFMEVILSSGATMLMQAKKAKTLAQGKKMVLEAIDSGKALEKFKVWIKAQKGNVDAIFKNDFWKPKYKVEVKSTKSGYMEIVSAVKFGIAAMNLGAGRETKEDTIDNDAGININIKTGEKVKKNDVLFTLYSSRKISQDIVTYLKDAYKITSKPVKNKVVLAKLGGKNG